MSVTDKISKNTYYAHINAEIRYFGMTAGQVALLGGILIAVSATLGFLATVVILVPVVMIANQMRKLYDKGHSDILASYTIKEGSPNYVVDGCAVISRL